MADYQYTKANINTHELKNEILVSLTDIEGLTFNSPDNLTVHMTITLDPAQKTTLDNIVSNHNGALYNAKALKIAQIDRKTAQMISQGFTYDSNLFSMSPNAQTNWIGLNQAASQLTYPFGVTTIDDSEYIFNSATDVNNFFATGLSVKEAHVSSGRALKVQVNAATTVAGVDAIVDNR